MKNILLSEVKDKTYLLFAQVDSVQHYVRTILRPSMYHTIGKNTFIRESMSSSFISQQIMENMNFPKENYYYRRVALHARNPKFEANNMEKYFIDYFKKNPRKKIWEGIKQIHGKDYYITTRPVRFVKSCMRCHGMPSKAPSEITAQYGSLRGFNYPEGQISGLDLVGIPIETSSLRIKETAIRYAFIAFGGALFLFGMISMLFNRLVVHNLRLVLSIFHGDAKDKHAKEIFEKIHAGDEIHEIFHATEELGTHLKEARAKLEQYAENLQTMVTERTNDLEQETRERQQDVHLFVDILNRLNTTSSRPELLDQALALIGARFDVSSITYTSADSSLSPHTWPPTAQPSILPGKWKNLLTTKKALFDSHSALIPVVTQDTMWGLLSLHWDQVLGMPLQTRQVLTALGQQLALVIENLKALDDLLHQHTILQSVFGGISDPLLLLDISGQVIIANPAARTHFSWSDNTPATAIPLARILASHPAMQRAEKCWSTPPQPISHDIDICNHHLMVTIYPLQNAERLVMYVQDNTSEKKMIARIQQSEKMVAMGTFAAGLAHEINNPLGIILCYTELLRTSVRSSQELEDLSIIEKHAKQAQNVVQDLLNFAHVKKNHDIPCNLNTTLASLYQIFKVQAEAKHIQLSLNLPQSPVTMNISSRDMEHILTNLFINALDALTNHQGRIDIRSEVKKDAGVVLLVIRDNGPGIDENDLPHIFDPFYTTKDVGYGTGLGLSVVYNLIHDNEGEITVYNDNGAVFEITLPFLLPTDTHVPDSNDPHC